MKSQAGLQKLFRPFSESLVLTPVSRNPIQLPASTIEAVMSQPVRALSSRTARSRNGIRSPEASIIIVTFNNLVFNRICFESVLANTDSGPYEVVVVDNGSTDGTSAYLHSLARECVNLRVILNERNLGFAPAVNQGLTEARGEFLVLLNNDTLAPPEWLGRLLKHLGDPGIGLVGPVTNRTGNEAQIEIGYDTYGDLVTFCQEHCRSHASEVFDISMLAMFCVAMRREVYDRVGPLDERFEVGLFEDEDYSMRVRACGYRVVCAEDAFVHHFGQASLGKLAAEGKYGELFHANRSRWENKWGRVWEPHRHRTNPEYKTLVHEIRAAVRVALPPASIVAVVNKGDPELLKLDGRRGWHFPQSVDGQYSGHYPADSADAVALLETVRSKGAEFLLIPQTALWWLDHYKEFGNYLRSRFRVVDADSATCMIFDLYEPTRTAALQ